MIKEAIRRTEAAFENSGYWIHDHPKRVILMMLLVVVFLASQLPSIQFDTSTESFFEKDDKIFLETKAIIEIKDLDNEISLIVINDASSQQIVDTYPNVENINSIECSL